MPQSQGNTKLATSPFQPMAPMYNASQAMTPTYYAGLNAPRGYAEGGETGMNLDKLPSLNVNTGAQSYGISGLPQGVQNFITGLRMAGDSPNVNPGARVFMRMLGGANRVRH